MTGAANDVPSIGSRWLHSPPDREAVTLTAEMANDLAQSIAISVGIQRGLLQIDLDELRKNGIDLEGPRHAIRSMSCDQCRAWAAALEARGPLPLAAVASDARTREASYESGGRHLCRQCFAEQEALLDTAATLELTVFDLAQFAAPESVLRHLDGTECYLRQNPLSCPGDFLHSKPTGHSVVNEQSPPCPTPTDEPDGGANVGTPA